MTAVHAVPVRQVKGYRIDLALSRQQTLVTLAGEVDLAAAPSLSRLLDSIDILTVPTVVDMSAVTFLDSSGLAPLIHATRRRTAPHPPIYVTVPSPVVSRFLHIAGMRNGPVLDVRRWDQLATPEPEAV